MGWEEVVGTRDAQEIGGMAADQQLAGQHSCLDNCPKPRYDGAKEKHQLIQDEIQQDGGPGQTRLPGTDGSMPNHASSTGKSYGELNHYTPSFHPIGPSYLLQSSAILVIANTLACQLCQKMGYPGAHRQLLSEGDGEV